MSNIRHPAIENFLENYQNFLLESIYQKVIKPCDIHRAFKNCITITITDNLFNKIFIFLIIARSYAAKAATGAAAAAQGKVGIS